jgi:hypothetical protein
MITMKKLMPLLIIELFSNVVLAEHLRCQETVSGALSIGQGETTEPVYPRGFGNYEGWDVDLLVNVDWCHRVRFEVEGRFLGATPFDNPEDVEAKAEAGYLFGGWEVDLVLYMNTALAHVQPPDYKSRTPASEVNQTTVFITRHFAFENSECTVGVGQGVRGNEPVWEGYPTRPYVSVQTVTNCAYQFHNHDLRLWGESDGFFTHQFNQGRFDSSAGLNIGVLGGRFRVGVETFLSSNFGVGPGTRAPFGHGLTGSHGVMFRIILPFGAR